MVRLICGYVRYKINGELSPRRNRRDPRILQYSRFIVGNQEVQLEGKRNRGADERKKFEVGNLLTGARNGYLQPALKYVGGSARVYYAATCQATTNALLPNTLLFPKVNLQPPPQRATGMTAVRQIFRDDAHVTVTQDQSGMLRITIGSISTAVLQTRIQVLKLDSLEQYSPLAAVLAIERTQEVHAAERRLDLGTPQRMVDIIGGPVEGAPHLPKLTQNVAVDEALDSVARTFKGIVMYGICKQPDGKGLFQLGFIYGS
jgi:hypothetical protein